MPTRERCRPNTDPGLPSPTRARPRLWLRRVTPPSPRHDRPRSTCDAGHTNRTADFDVFLPSRIRHPSENRKAATSLTFSSLKRPSADLRSSTHAALETESCAPDDRNRSRSRQRSPTPPNRPNHSTGCRGPDDQRRRREPNSHGGKRRRNPALDPPSRPATTTRASTRHPDEPEETCRTPHDVPGTDEPPSGENPTTRRLAATPFLSCPLNFRPDRPGRKLGLQSLKEPAEWVPPKMNLLL